MSTGTLVPYLPRTALFMRGLMSRSPCLKVLMAHLPEDGSPDRLACERALELLLRQLPVLPTVKASAAELERLASPGGDFVSLLAAQMNGPYRSYHDLWRPVWSSYPELPVRQFAQRCAIILTELFRLSRTRIN